jgi:Trypsin
LCGQHLVTNMNIQNRSNRCLAGGILFLFAIAAGTIAFIGQDGVGMATERRLQGNSQGNQGQGGLNADGSCGPGNNPVCVGGEITYQTGCLAQAQGEMVFTNGPCSGQDMAQFKGNGAATAEEMGRFKGEGFKLVGKVTNIAFQPPKYDVASPSQAPPGQLKKLARVTIDGLKYATTEHIPGPPMQQGSPDLGNPDAPLPDPGFVDPEDGGVRKLQIAPDTRSVIAHPDTDPYYYRLGEIDWGSSEGGCSGSIVGANKVLTAAHCVFNTDNNQW